MGEFWKGRVALVSPLSRFRGLVWGAPPWRGVSEWACWGECVGLSGWLAFIVLFAGFARFARSGEISGFSGCAGVAGQVLHDGLKSFSP